MDEKIPVKDMRDLRAIGPRMKWQFFERLVAFVFEQNGFRASVGVVRKTGSGKRQYDVIAEGPRHVFAADCKRWTGRRYKESQLKGAADKQAERCGWLKQGTDKEIIPMIVTLLPEAIVVHGGVPIVPFEKLNSFINGWEERDESIMRI